MAFTVTATQSGSSSSHGVALTVRVLTNAVESGGAAVGNRSTSGAVASGSLTPNFSGSYIAFSVSADNVTSMPAVAANNTYDKTTGNATDVWSTAQGHYTGTVTGGTPLTFGAGTAGAADHSNWCAYEVPASGGTITLDGSSPTPVALLTSGTAISTASFTPPAGSVLVAEVCAGGSGAGTGVTVAMTDTSGGLVGAWTQRITSLAADNFQPTYVFTATVGSPPAPPTPTSALPLAPGWHPGRNLPGLPGGTPFRAAPSPVTITIAPVTANLAGAGAVSANATVIATASLAGAGSVTAKPAPAYIAGLAGSGYNSWFKDQYGNPKLMLLEQAWALPWNAGRWNSGGATTYQTDMDAYFAARASQGYTSWYGIAWGNTHVDSTALSGGRSWDGVFPLNINGTPGAIATGSETVTLNSTFWARIDYLFATAATYGISCVLNVMFRYAMAQSGGCLDVGVWTNTNTQGTAFGAALAARYPQATYPHVFWFFGDDDDGPNDSFYQAILTGMQGAGDTRALISIEQFTNTNCHIEFDNKTSFSGSFGAPNATYNWVYSYDAPYFGCEDSYAEGGTFPHIPAVYGDGVYYGDLAGQTNQVVQRQVRNFTWWALSSGSRGFPCTSGPSDIGVGPTEFWQWPSDAVARLTTDPNGTFTTSTVGAIASFFSGLADWNKLIPDTGNVFITAGRGTRGTCDGAGGVFNFRNTSTYVSGSVTPSGSLAVIYCKAAMSITIDQTKVAAGYTATWVDPVSLATQSTATGSTYASSGLGNNSAGDPDWVLVLQGPTVAPSTATIAGAGSVTAAVTQACTASLAGAGSLTAVATVIATATAAAAGAVTAVVTEAAPATAAAAGAVTAVVTEAVTATAAGAGSVAALVTEAVKASPAGAGAVTDVATEAVTATAAGAGALTGTVTGIAGGSCAGAGAVAAVVTQACTASLAGAGSVSANASVISGANTATLSGAGGVTAVVTEIVTATSAGAGSVTAAVAQSAGANLAGAGAIGAPDVTQAVTASLAGAGSVTAAVTQIATATLAGAGALSATTGGFASGTATLAGAGALTAAGSVSAIATASLAGAGSLTAVVTERVPATIAGASALAASPSGLIPGTATLTGAGALSAAASQHGAIVAAASSATVTARDTSMSTVTDPRDGTASVTAAATSRPSVS